MDYPRKQLVRPSISPGDTFGLLTVLRYDRARPGKYKRWICKCECGRKKSIIGYSLKKGATKSCGHPSHRPCKGKMTKHPLYHTWQGMKQRCLNPQHKAYARYGGRGVTVCWDWQSSFEEFAKDVGPKPDGDFLLDRIDNDGDYVPSNVRWVTRKQQQRNMRTNRILEVDGSRKTLQEWAEITGIHHGTLRARILRGWPHAKAVETAVRTRS